MTGLPGTQLLHACSTVDRTLVLCAPFIKTLVLTKLLSTISSTVRIEVFTRWRPEEVAAGVSDTGYLDPVERRGGAVYLCDRLHAKYARFDDQALVGSANLTLSALGWSPTPNLELLTELPADTPQLVELEQALRDESVRATADTADEVARVAALLPTFVPSEPATVSSPTTELPACPQSPPVAWSPRLREPRDLFLAYSEGHERLTHASAHAVEADLRALDIPSGLERGAFEAIVRTRLLQASIVHRVDHFLDDPHRFGAVRILMQQLLQLDRAEAEHAWQTLMRWLLYFLPDRYQYSVPRHSEVLTRTRKEDTQ